VMNGHLRVNANTVTEFHLCPRVSRETGAEHPVEERYPWGGNGEVTNDE
jgi:hypothetical protein